MKKEKKYIQAAIDFKNKVLANMPPQAKELKEAALGAKMLEKDAFDTVVGILKPECFYVGANQPTENAADANKKEELANPRQQNEIIRIRLGIFGLWVVNPTQKSVQIILIAMGFVLLFTTLVFLLRHFL